MKIGIMSMQRIVNYGSFLQSYGLMSILKELGHEVEFVDYRVDKPLFQNEDEKKKYNKEKIRNYLMEVILNFEVLLPLLSPAKQKIFKHNIKYKKEYFPMLGITTKKNYNAKLDLLIIGSDEVFNCLQNNTRVGYSKELFGYNNRAKKVISYAGCFGNTTLERLQEYGVKDEIAGLLKNMNAISVRDRNSGKIVKKLTGTEPEYNLDPVLIHDFSKEINQPLNKKDYIIVYAYRNRLSEEEKKEIVKLAKKKNKKIVCMGGYQSFCDEYITVSPLEVFKYIKNADYIITDTFHGTIFSTICHKQFGVFIRQSGYGNSEKVSDLLERLKLTSRKVVNVSDLEKVLDSEIDYKSVDLIIEKERKHTREYLIKQLEN